MQECVLLDPRIVALLPPLRVLLRSLEAFRRRALSTRDPKLLEGFPAATIVERLANSWHASALRLYRNWLSCLATRRERSLHEVTAVATIYSGQTALSGGRRPATGEA